MRNIRSCSFFALSGCLAQQGSLKYGSKATRTSARCVVQCSKRYEKKLLPALLDKAEKQQPMTSLEKDFLEENMTEIDSEEKKSYNG